MRGAWSFAFLLLAACGEGPPHDFHDADGALDSNPSCFTYDGMASITLDDGYQVTVQLPPYPNVWGRGGVSLVYGDPASCYDSLGTAGARVQYGDPVPDPGCPGCDDQYRPLFVEGLAFPSVTACSSCDPTDCRAFDATHADRWYLWCDTTLESP